MLRMITLEAGADPDTVRRHLAGMGVWTQLLSAPGVEAMAIEPHSARVSRHELEAIDGVAVALGTSSCHPMVDAQAGRPVEVAGVRFGSEGWREPLLFAGPCSVESEAQIRAAAALVARAGGVLLRGGAFKPRTSPYSFAGHGRRALTWLRDAADAWGLGVVTEVMDGAEVAAVAEVADLLQVGSRNMANYTLLAAVGAVGKPVLLKRGSAATLDEWLQAGEHLLSAGAAHVLFCERGVRGFDPETRNLLDLGGAALLKHVYNQPVVVDPSHATGRRDLVLPLCRAAAALGVDALLVEAHPDATAARSDGPQALSPGQLLELGHRLGAPGAPSLGPWVSKSGAPEVPV